MFRLSLLVILAVCSGLSHQQSYPCRRQQRTRPSKVNHETLFNELAQKVMDIDAKIKDSCVKNSNGATKEYIEQNRYVIQTPLPDYSDDDVVISIRQKVMQIEAKNGDKRYKELRILPNFADEANAAYTLEDGNLQIVFPFKTGPNTCDTSASNSLITVRKFDPFGAGTGTGPRGSFPVFQSRGFGGK